MTHFFRTTWNTGRLYTREGQIMVAAQLDDGTILFADLSRMIDGHMPKPARAITSKADLQRHVDDRYLHNAYQTSHASRQFYADARKAAHEADHARRVCRVADALSRK